MLTPWEDEPDDAHPKRKPYARAASSHRVGALTYPDREEYVPTEIVSYLKLRGRWLDKLGFDVGARLKVEATHGSITLTVVERPVPVVKKIPRKLQRRTGWAPAPNDVYPLYTGFSQGLPVFAFEAKFGLCVMPFGLEQAKLVMTEGW
ncbi:MAG: SymE family type I addiction module toxin [Stenotrophomonas sp.]|uniref:SymE family type I addiction module toxin n=1 Tax=Stenotrophomonas sp. TaxID=69392 RepID=UPI003315974B